MNSQFRRFLVSLTLLTLAVGCGLPASQRTGAPAEKENFVAAYLTGAERHSESDAQRRNIATALRDMLDQSPAALRTRRYPDYQGRPGAWNAPELLRRHFVPPPGRSLTDADFFRDVAAPAARAAVRQQLDALTGDARNP